MCYLKKNSNKICLHFLQISKEDREKDEKDIIYKNILRN